MLVQTTLPPKKKVIGLTIAYAFLLYAGWTLAWLLALYIGTQSNALETAFGHFLYWTAMRVLLWVLLPMLLLKRIGLNIREVFFPRRVKATVLWGIGAGLMLGLVTILFRLIAGQPPFSTEWGWPLLTMALIAPVVEEVFFRGAVLHALKTCIPFTAANLLTSLLFLLAHLPGWYFQGRLTNMLLSPFNGALGVFILGWIFGYIAHKTRSVPAAILTHALNNFFNS
jgi:membrane protease YdiL (CAAX protease family)